LNDWRAAEVRSSLLPARCQDIPAQFTPHETQAVQPLQCDEELARLKLHELVEIELAVRFSPLDGAPDSPFHVRNLERLVFRVIKKRERRLLTLAETRTTGSMLYGHGAPPLAWTPQWN
jgi:hypothetical protein